LTPDRQ